MYGSARLMFEHVSGIAPTSGRRPLMPPSLPISTSSGVLPAAFGAEFWPSRSSRSTKYAAGLSTERQSSHWQKSRLPNRLDIDGNCCTNAFLEVWRSLAGEDRAYTGAELSKPLATAKILN